MVLCLLETGHLRISLATDRFILQGHDEHALPNFLGDIQACCVAGHVADSMSLGVIGGRDGHIGLF